MKCCHRHSPIQCIIPPHMVDALRDSGDADIIAFLEELEFVSSELRELRDQTSPAGALGFMGEILSADELSAANKPGLTRHVYSAENSSDLQQKLMRSEGQDPHEDPVVNEAYDGAGDTYELFHKVYKRDSLDNAGMPLISSVHVRRKFNNAFWNGRQMAYGDGDGKIFIRFTLALSVIGHELTHGLVQFSGGLNYVYQSGALNEHIADVFGCLTEQYKKKLSASEADWLVGKEILAPGINGKALRSMKEPGEAYNDPLLGKDPQPRHMDKFVRTTRDNGGVHINSGIPNHAFYKIATSLGGNAWEKPGKIWYESLQQLKDPDATFAKWATLTTKVAGDLFGAGSAEQKAVEQGWKDVGVFDKEGKPSPALLESINNPPQGLPSAAQANTDGTRPPATALATTQRGFLSRLWRGFWGLFGFYKGER